MDATHVDYSQGKPQPVYEAPHETRDVGIAYVLLLLFGMLGGHNFYARRTGVAIAQLLMTVLIVGIPVVFVWVIVDAFLLPGFMRDLNDQVRRQRNEA